jgi:ABC-type multidrug transport system fused ATPase/permease subunit
MNSPKDYIKLIGSKILYVIIGLTIIFISNVVGHFAGPFSIMATPIILPLIVGGINSSLYKTNYYLTVLYGFGLLLLNDLLVRLYAGGIHDDAGKGWIALVYIFAFSICVLTMTAFAFRLNKLYTTKRNTLAVSTKIVFVIVLATLVGLFYDKYLSKF